MGIVRALPPSLLSPAADLVYTSFSGFYDLFGVERTEIAESLCNQFGFVSELSDYVTMIDGGEVLGIICYYPLVEAEERKMVGLKSLLGMVSAKNRATVMQRLKSFTAGIPTPVQQSGLYLARVAVAANRQGSGVAQQLMAAVFDHACIQHHGEVLLHVDSQNNRAQRFYVKSGFKTTESHPYNLMKVSLNVLGTTA